MARNPSDSEMVDAAVHASLQAKSAAATAGAVGRQALREVQALKEDARPAPADPRDGPLHVPRELLSEEAASRLRLSPRRNRWPELAALENEIVELERRASSLLAEVQELNTRRDQEERTYPETLAGWLADPRGPRPVSPLEELDARIAERRVEYEALRVLRERTLQQRAGFVARHRRRLDPDPPARRRDRAAPR
jgi:hypothetical protein